MASRLVAAFRRRQRLNEKPKAFLLELVEAEGVHWKGYGVTRHTRRRTWFADGTRERSVDRAALERDGYAWSRGRMLFTEAGAQRVFGPNWHDPGRSAMRPVSRPRRNDALMAIGLNDSATLDDVRKKYRRGAFERHPDRGGNATEFIEWSRACKPAMRALGPDAS